MSSKAARPPAGEPMPPPPPSRPRRGRLRLGRGQSRPARPKFEGPLLPLVVFSLISMAVRAEDAALGVMLPQIRAEFGINLQFIVAIGSLVTVVGLVFAPVLGWTADRVQRVVMVRIAAVLSALGGVLQGIAPGVTHFTGGRVVSGASIAVAQPASFPLMTDYYPAHSRARAFTIYFAATQIGAMLGPPVAGVIADRTSWRVAIISLGMVAAAAALLAFFVKEPRRGQADDAAVPEAAEHVSFAEAYRAARSIVTLRRIWYATPFLAISGLFNLVILPSYLAEVFQMSSTQLGIVTAALHGSAFLGLLVAGPLSERLLADRPGRVMTLGGALTVGQSVLLVGLSLAGNIPTAVAMVLPLAFLNTILLPAFYSVIALVVPPRIRGLGLQTVAPWQVLGLVGVPFVLDWATQLGVRQGILVFVPLLVIGGVIFASAGSGVERDIRAAAAAARARRVAPGGRRPARDPRPRGGVRRGRGGRGRRPRRARGRGRGVARHQRGRQVDPAARHCGHPGGQRGSHRLRRPRHHPRAAARDRDPGHRRHARRRRHVPHADGRRQPAGRVCGQRTTV